MYDLDQGLRDDAASLFPMLGLGKNITKLGSSFDFALAYNLWFQVFEKKSKSKNFGLGLASLIFGESRFFDLFVKR
jgi:hypothetical protein